METKRSFYNYYFSAEGIKYREVEEKDFSKFSYGFIVEESDLTDYSRLVPSELRHHKRYRVLYCKYGCPQNIVIDQIEFCKEIIFDEARINHPTIKGYMLTNSLTFTLNWHNPFEKKDFSIRLNSEFTYPHGILGLYGIYFIYFTFHSCDSWENDCKYLWSILNARAELFDTGGSLINFSNFEYGKFITGIVRLYNEFELEIDDYKFMKPFYNCHIKQALSILENERKRLYLNTNNFQLL